MIETHQFDDITLLIALIPQDNALSRREAERGATLQLLVETLGEEVEIAHHKSGAPYLIGSELHISLSHSMHYAAVALSPSRVMGVDIEEPRPQLRKVAPRVLSDAEAEAYSASDALLLQAWTLKEALYKAALTPGLDFRRDINLPIPPSSPYATVLNRPYLIKKILTTPTYTCTVAARYDLSELSEL